MPSILEGYLGDLLEDSGFKDPEKSDLRARISKDWNTQVEATIGTGVERADAEFEVFRRYVPNITSMLRYGWNPKVRAYLLGVLGKNLCYFILVVGAIWVIGHEGEGYKTETILFSLSLGAWLLAVYCFEWSETVRIEDGTRIVRRFFFKKKIIQIANIREITTSRSLYLIFHNDIIKTEDDRLELDWDTKGRQSVIAIVKSLKPEVSIPGPKAISNRRIIQILLLLTGCLAAVCYLIAFAGVWNIEGLSFFLPIALILGAQVSIAEIFFHKDRTRIALVWLRLSLLTPIPPFLAFLGLGRPDLFQWTALLWLLFFILLILNLVWWGKSSWLFRVSMVLLVSGLLSYFLIPPLWKGQKETWATAWDFNAPFVWVGNDRIAVIYNGYNDPSNLRIYARDGIQKEMNLGTGRCEFMEPYSKEVLTLKKSAWRVAGSSEEILLCDMNGGKRILPFDPRQVSYNYSNLVGTPLWSPERKSLLLMAVAEDASGERKHSVAIGDASTGAIRKSEDWDRLFVGKWIDEEEIRAVEIKSAHLKTDSSSEEYYIRVHRFDTVTGTAELKAHYPLAKTELCWSFPGGEYAFLIHPSRFSEIKTELMRLTDGERMSLPPLSKRIEGFGSGLLPFSWSESSHRVAYFSEINGKPSLSVIGVDGFQATLTLNEDLVFGDLNISPNGNHVIYDLCSNDRSYLEPLVQVFHWGVGDSESERLRVAKLGIGVSFNPCTPCEPPPGLGIIPSLARWSPNSKKVAFWGMLESEGFSSPLWVYHLD